MEPKKRSLGAAERDEFLRSAWRLLFARAVDAERLVVRGRDGSQRLAFAALCLVAPRGAGSREDATQLGQENLTLLASIMGEGLGPWDPAW